MISKNTIKTLIYFLLIISIVACKKAGEGFAGFSDSTEESSNVLIEAPVINSFSPTQNPVILLSSTEKTFVLGVNSTSGTVSYDFILDGATVKSGTSSFYTLEAISITPGSHTLIAKAINSKGSTSKTFNVYKNSPPTFTLNSQTATTINCSSGTFVVNLNATDADSDNITFSFLLNGSANGTYLTGTSGTNSASATFTPSCSLSGSNFVTVRATDSKGEYTDYTTNITVTNPFSASINNFSPTSEPTVIPSTATTNFSISPSGTSPFNYSWSVTPGSNIASCNGLATCPIQGTDFTPGRYVLTATLTDNLPSTASKAFTIVLNQKPQVVATPSNATTLNMNCGTIKNFNLVIEDANYGDNTQNYSVSWKLNGSPHASLTATTVLNAYPMTSEATFSPNCDSSLIGNQSVSVVISDGHESQTYIWPLNVNYFSETCNNLTSGQICTAAGRLGMEANLNLTTSSTLANLIPTYIEKHSADTYFISDNNRHGVWFFNNSASAKTVFGSTIPAKTLKLLIGQGISGSNTPTSYADLYLNAPRALAYNAATGDLYISDHGNSRIIKVDNSGLTSVFAGGGSGNTDGATRTSHRCINPKDLVLDTSENKLFASCNGNTNTGDGTVKYFRTDVDQGYTFIKFSTANANGTTGSSSSTATMRPSHGLSKHPTKKILFVSELTNCRIAAASYGDSDTFFSSARSVGANQMTLLTDNTDCGHTVNLAYSNTALRIRPYDIAPQWNGVEINALYISNNYGDSGNSNISVINTSSSIIYLAGTSINPGFVNNITVNGQAYSRDIPAYSSTRLNQPLGIIIDGQNLIVTDQYNGRISKFDLTLPNGAFIDLVGSELPYLYDSEVQKSLNLKRFNRPTSLSYNSNDDSLMIVDENNYRVRKLNLRTGNLNTIMGSGSAGNANINPSSSAFTVGTQNIQAISFIEEDDLLIFSDYYGSVGTNRNCHVRALNMRDSLPSSNDVTLFNQTFVGDQVRSIAGSYTAGCASNYTAGTATLLSLLYPYGIQFNSATSDLYISDRGSQCIFKIDSAGNRSNYIGNCQTSTFAATPTSDSISTSHKINLPGLIKRDRGINGTNNFFVIHNSRTTNSEVRYANVGTSDVTINYITIGPGEIKTIYSTLNYVNGISSFGEQICVSQGTDAPTGSASAHNVECYNRNTSVTSLRIGRPSAATVKGKIPLSTEQEGVNAASASLANPYDVEFDGEGNLWISEMNSHNIRKVKKWFSN